MDSNIQGYLLCRQPRHIHICLLLMHSDVLHQYSSTLYIGMVKLQPKIDHILTYCDCWSIWQVPIFWACVMAVPHIRHVYLVINASNRIRNYYERSKRVEERSKKRRRRKKRLVVHAVTMYLLGCTCEDPGDLHMCTQYDCIYIHGNAFLHALRLCIYGYWRAWQGEED